MSMRRGFPPLGPVAALAGAIIMHFYLADENSVPIAAFIGGPKDQVVAEPGSGARIAPVSDIALSIVSFQNRPLLAEGRRTPQVVPKEAAIEPEEKIEEPVVDPEPIPEPQPVFVEPLEPPVILMLGSMSNANGDAVLISEGPDQTQRWVRLGEDIAGWILIEITPVSIRLTSAGSETTIDLFR